MDGAAARRRDVDPEVKRAGAGDGIATRPEPRRHPAVGAGDELARDGILGRARLAYALTICARRGVDAVFVVRGHTVQRRRAAQGLRGVLMTLDLRRQLFRQSEFRVLRDAARELRIEGAVEHLVGGAVAAEESRTGDRLPHGADHLRDEQRLELARDLERRLASEPMLLLDAARRAVQERAERTRRKWIHAVLLTSARTRRRARRQL